MKRVCWLALFCCLAHGSIEGGEKEGLKPTNLDKINTAGDEDDPFVLGDTLWYTLKKKDRHELFVAKKAGTTWLTGKMLLADKDADFRSPFFYPKNSTLYYATNQIPDEKFKNLQNYDLKAKVGERAGLPLPGISEKEDELHPWITAAGKEFYFSRKVDKGWKLFVANGPSPGPIGKAQEVGFAAGFHHATFTASGQVMYLQGPLENGRWGIFRSKRAKIGGKWSMPEELSALNHEGGKRGDMSPCLNAEGTRLYFSSDRPGGKGGLDLWSIATKDLK